MNRQIKAPQAPRSRIVNALLRVCLAFAATRAGGWFFTRVTPPLDRALLSLSRGRWNIALGVMPILLLTTTGRHSGKRYRTPLLYVRDDAIYLIASGGGSARHPAWYHNAVGHTVGITVAGRHYRATASVVEGAERQRIWQRFCAINPGFAAYQSRLRRQIPIVRAPLLADSAPEQPTAGSTG